MKIIREGAIPMPPPCWPLGSGFECFHCGCRFEFEPGDIFEIATEKRLDGDAHMTTCCPCCGVKIKATRPKTTSSSRFLVSSSDS